MKKQINLILAMSENNIIGHKNSLPWHLKEDLKFFKKMTTNSSIIMGYKTYESLNKIPLPNRENIVLTRTHTEQKDGFHFCENIDNAIKTCSLDNIYIIGGANLYLQFFENNLFNNIYLTKIHHHFEGDTEIKYDFNKLDKEEILPITMSENGLNYSITKYINQKLT